MDYTQPPAIHAYAKHKTVEEKLAFQLEKAIAAMEVSPKNFQLAKQENPFPLYEEESVFADCTVGVAETIGRRPTMEDEHLATPFFFTLQGISHSATLFGVFDGHGGKHTATRVKDELSKRLKEALESAQGPIGDEVIANALTKVCVEMGDDFSKDNPFNAGTCATIAFVLDKTVYIANVGDSRAILVTEEGEILQLSEDAKPTLARFWRSIVKRNGVILFGRAGGRLAIARDIGLQYIPGVIARPKITKVALKPKDTLCIACDGVWDVATTREVGRALSSMKGKTACEKARCIVNGAVGNGSFDNVTCMVIAY